MARKKSGQVKFYAVRKGVHPGVYTSWDECKPNVDGYPGAEHKSFSTRQEAEAWLNAAGPGQQVQQHRFPAAQQTYAVRHTSPPESANAGSVSTTMRTFVPDLRDDTAGKYWSSAQQAPKTSVVVGAGQGMGQYTNLPAVERARGLSQSTSFLRGDSEGSHQTLVGERPENYQPKKQKTGETSCTSRPDSDGFGTVETNPGWTSTSWWTSSSTGATGTTANASAPSGSAQTHIQPPAPARESYEPSFSSATTPASSTPPVYAREPSWHSPSSANVLSNFASSATPSSANMRIPANPTNPSGPSSSTANNLTSTTLVIQQGVYTVEYDGAAKGNPGPAGAGALLRDPSGEVVKEVMVGLGRTSNNVAEYRGVIAGLTAAFRLGVQHLSVQGDSNLVCQQVEGNFKVKAPHLMPLLDEVLWLKQQFTSCEFKHVPRAYNAAADELANRAVHLPEESLF